MKPNGKYFPQINIEQNKTVEGYKYTIQGVDESSNAGTG